MGWGRLRGCTLGKNDFFKFFKFIFYFFGFRESGGGVGGESGVGQGWVHIESKIFTFFCFFFMFLAQNLLGRGGPKGPPNEGLKGPLMPSAGARRKGP